MPLRQRKEIQKVPRGQRLSQEKLMAGSVSKNEREQDKSGGRMLTVSQVARLLNVHPNTVRSWADQSLLKAYRSSPKRHRLFDLVDIERYSQTKRHAADTRAAKTTAKSKIWDSPRVKAILNRAQGTPIDLSGLTEAERGTLAREAKGMWADHPEVTDSVTWVKELWTGRSFEPLESR